MAMASIFSYPLSLRKDNTITFLKKIHKILDLTSSSVVVKNHSHHHSHRSNFQMRKGHEEDRLSAVGRMLKPQEKAFLHSLCLCNFVPKQGGPERTNLLGFRRELKNQESYGFRHDLKHHYPYLDLPFLLDEERCG